MSTPSDDHAPAADRPPAEHGLGGDPACWLHLVCDACGRLVEDQSAEVCPACGAPLH